MQFITSLAELKQSDRPLAGGKGANLGALIQAGMPTPPGFCVTTEGYGVFVADNALDGVIQGALECTCFEDANSLETASAQIRAAFSRGQIQPNLAAEIAAAYQLLASDPASPSTQHVIPVAVRSSATAEDLPEFSFAGQQDTYLNIVGQQAVLAAVKDCWSSLWTGRAIGYRARNGIPQNEVALAVVIQAMVPSEASGVLFTANPLTGKRSETVIDATLGLGEALVSGQVEPDHYVVAGDRVVDKKLGAKALTMRGKAGGGVQSEPTDAGQIQALTDEHILALARLGQQAQAVFGEPQDIEWAFFDQRLYIVQSRPITALYPALPGAKAGELLVGLSFGAVQGMLDPMTPLGRDIFGLLVAALGRHIGMPVSFETQRGLLDAGERLWLNFTAVMRNPVGRRIIVFFFRFIEPGSQEALQALLQEESMQGGRFRRSIFFRMRRILLPLVFNALRNLANPAAGRQRLQTSIDVFLRGVQTHAEQARTLDERLDVITKTFEHMPELFITRLLPAVVSGQFPLQLLIRLCSDLPNGYTSVLELTRGLPHNVTTEMDLALWQTARVIKSDAAARANFTGKDAATLSAEYLAGELPAAAQGAVGRFMLDFGMRGVGEIDLGRRRWRDEPTALMAALSSYLRIEEESASPEAVFKRGQIAAVAAEEHLVSMLRKSRRGSIKAHLARKLAYRVRELTGLRETPKFAAIRAMGIQRQVLIEGGRELAAAGVLEKPEDVFFLRYEELRRLAQNAPQPKPLPQRQDDAPDRGEAGKEVRGLIAERRAVYAREMRRKQAPRVLLSDGRAFYEGMGASAAADGAIVGSPVSPGVVEGAVRVVLDPRGAQLAPGEILVCPGTDPAWTPLFLVAGGLVMEVGGMMTHGSVVAREYGIPAVVGVHQATTRFKTGQRIRVDGSTGKIMMLD